MKCGIQISPSSRDEDDLADEKKMAEEKKILELVNNCGIYSVLCVHNPWIANSIFRIVILFCGLCFCAYKLTTVPLTPKTTIKH